MAKDERFEKIYSQGKKENHGMNRQRAASTGRYIGMFLMIVLSLTQLIPSLEMAGGSIWIGLASFFTVEAIEKVPRKESGLRFSTLGRDLKGRITWLLILLLVCVQIANVILGCLIFDHAYIDYDLGRSFDVMGSANVAGLLALIPIAAWGEEIAWRGFFLGKQPKQVTPWVWVVFVILAIRNGTYITTSYIHCVIWNRLQLYLQPDFLHAVS